VFAGTKVFNQDLNNWKTGNVTHMVETFRDTQAFNGDISTWETHNVINFNRMFEGALEFNQDLLRGKGGNLNVWNLSNVGTVKPSTINWLSHTDDYIQRAVFKNAKKFNGNISNWYTHNFVSFEEFFSGAEAFNGYVNTGGPANDDPNIWNVSNVGSFKNASTRDMYAVFQNAKAFNQSLDRWDVSNARIFADMFNGASVFNQPLNNWSVAKGGTYLTEGRSYAPTWLPPTHAQLGQFYYYGFARMFKGATVFNQPLDNWDVANTEPDSWFTGTQKSLEFREMFENSAMTNDLSGWCVSSKTIAPSNFSSGSIPVSNLPVWGTCP